MNNKWGFNKIGNFFKIQSFKYKGRKKIYLFGTLIYFGAFTYLMRQKIKGQIERGDLYHQYLTRTTKQLSQWNIPVLLRVYLYKKYAKKYGVNLEQIQKPLIQYQNFSQFFTRGIKPRLTNKQSMQNNKIICCPCDSQILNISKVTQDKNVIIKDIQYSLNSLLFGQINPTQKERNQNMSTLIEQKKQSDLHQVIFYLSPGDYHRFHAPADMTVLTTRSYEGKLRPVNMQSLLKFGGKVYQQNARKILHCFYSSTDPHNKLYLNLAMIGALNVSDIVFNGKWEYKKGEQIGYFNLGSTIVMLIQSKGNLKWNKKIGDKVKYGQNLCQFI